VVSEIPSPKATPYGSFRLFGTQSWKAEPQKKAEKLELELKTGN